MSIIAKPIEEPVSHKEAVKLANQANQAAMLIKNAVTSGITPQGSTTKIEPTELEQHFTPEDWNKLKSIAATV